MLVKMLFKKNNDVFLFVLELAVLYCTSLSDSSCLRVCDDLSGVHSLIVPVDVFAGVTFQCSKGATLSVQILRGCVSAALFKPASVCSWTSAQKTKA